ncbi:hypothetical protein AWI29_08580 [Enterobacter hormaechei subsp. xiangfangensis]|jgi:hypothetical protein|uniref:hypothetical protein n=1 Tax=Enterobacter hormaechei TaxID=158836 RepID=UPI0007506C31|nr:hypothetical protein [Enterobacter hormaechei]KUQ98084.1 hypothetical protein AWI29_08580 [Enterobacter hormaechei subsp. xiangfangensis]
MGSTKEWLCEVQEERAHEWVITNYPEAEEGTPEWDHALQEYGWFQDWMEEAAEQQDFEASLERIPDRLHEALDELRELEGLIINDQPNIALRMAFAHTVTVLDSFLMYSARALLNHLPHLQLFLQNADSLVRNKEDRKVLRDPLWSEQEPNVKTPDKAYIWRAQALVSKMTFQNPKIITRYFSTMLVSPHDWKTEQLQVVINTRNDLVHRNGITLSHEPVDIWPDRVKDAIRLVSDFIETAAATLLQEDALYRTDDEIF